MEERRKNKRTAMNSRLLIKRLDNEEKHIEVDIEILDVSKSGVGFKADQLLKIGEVYESYLTIWTKEVLHAFLQIVRIELQGEDYVYGAVFIGMPEMDASRIEIYQTLHNGE
ncbi:MAG: PilZ domain-containing protein [Acetatifactor sp.]|nr:PilZ domain-containing protein [Acetatifactor sp.]